VSDYKRNDLMKVLEIIPSSVDEVWVFGSAVTPYCRPDSDLDVCIVGNNITKEDRSCIAHATRHAMDLLDITQNEFAAESLDKNSIFYQVKNNGVLVYKRGIGVING
ncbi:MAG: nucleotidyltransferase domain-containing protein, partial [Eubacterium sp.]|nr:nucleotidyltransferase domain-containing protein [Eubacterium sp.]